MPTDRQIMNARAAELNDDPEEYFKEMKTAWLMMIETEAEQYFDNNVEEQDDRPTMEGFLEYLEQNGEDFTFKDYETWFVDEVSSAADSYGDAKYEEMRDSKYD